MANTVIQIKKSTVSGNVPVSLANGELAINSADGRLYYRTPAGLTGYIYTPSTFGTINANNTLILAGSNTDTLTINSGNNIVVTGSGLNKSITIGLSNNVTLSYNTPSVQQLAVLSVAGANTKGGLGYTDFLQANNQYPGATNTNKWFRLDSSGNLQIINSAYTTNIFQLSDVGVLTVPNVTLNSGGGGVITFADGTTQGTSANSAALDQTARNIANSAGSFANGAFLQANSVYGFANSAYAAQNTTASFANSAFTVANSASSNTVTTQGVDLTQNTNIASAQSFANGAFLQANSAYGVANSAASFANGAFITANSAYTAQNATASIANTAWTTANVGYNFVNSGGTVSGAVTINGNLTVNGTQTIVNSNLVSYNNPYIALHSANTGYLVSNDGVDIGLDAEYYSSTSIAPRLVTGGSANGTYATLNLSDNTYYAPNTSVLIQGVTPSNFNGSYTVSSASPGSLTYALAFTGTVTTTNGTSLGTAQRYTQVTVTGGSTVSGSKVSTVTFTPAITIPVGATITIANCTPTGYNGTWTVTASSAGSVSFVNTANQTNITVNGIIVLDNRRAALVRANDSQAFEFYKAGTWYNGAFEGMYGTVKASRFFASPSQGSPGADILNGFLGTTTETIYDTTSAANLVNGQTATANLAILTIGAANTNVHYNGASTLRIMGAPIAGNNVTFDSNSYSIQVDSGDSWFNGNLILSGTGGVKFADGTRQTTNAATYAYSTAGYNQANLAFTQANSAYAAQNTTAGFANAAYTAQNTTATFANSAFVVANGAAFVANTDYTNISITSGTYGNSAYIPVVTVSANGRVNTISTIATNAPTVSGWSANSVIFANSTGYLSNTSNLTFASTTNTLKANALVVIGNTATSNQATLLYNASLNSIDFIFT